MRWWCLLSLVCCAIGGFCQKVFLGPVPRVAEMPGVLTAHLTAPEQQGEKQQ